MNAEMVAEAMRVMDNKSAGCAGLLQTLMQTAPVRAAVVEVGGQGLLRITDQAVAEFFAAMANAKMLVAA